jgi:hypothetical protein
MSVLADYLAVAAALGPGAVDGAERLLYEAAACEPRLSAEDGDALIDAIHQALGGDLQSLKQAWVKALTDAFREEAADQATFSREDILKLIGGLKKYDEEGAKDIIAAVVPAELSPLVVASLMKPFAKALGIDLKDAKSFWKAAEEQAKAAAFARPDIREERERAQREEAERQQAEIAAEQERIWQACRSIAESPTLLADMVKLVQRLGVVGERASIKGVYMAASSRFNASSSICLVRLGAPAGGKNYLVSTTLKIIPDDAVVNISSGSPLSLVYYGGGDENALKHKVLYVPEAAVIAEREGNESLLTVMLRLLISERRLDHNVAVPKGSGPPVTERIVRHGPVVVIVTTARNNIEEELLTRLMTSSADETPGQTRKIVLKALKAEDDDGGVPRAEIERWLAFQRWLAVKAPYRATVPYRRAIRVALVRKWRTAKEAGENMQLRLRRDVHGFLTAIKTSAILHQAQRQKDERGRIVATLADYAHAHAAYDAGLASLYKVRTPDTVMAVVRAVHGMGARPGTGVKVTVSALMTALGITGRGTANDRLREAVDRGFLAIVDKRGGYGRTSPREYELTDELDAIERKLVAASLTSVFPSPKEIEKALSFRGYSGTGGTRPAKPKKSAISEDAKLYQETGTADDAELYRGSGTSKPKKSAISGDAETGTADDARLYRGSSTDSGASNPKDSAISDNYTAYTSVPEEWEGVSQFEGSTFINDGEEDQ